MKRYTSSATHRSRLTSITECGPNTCLPATTISWQNGTAGFGGTANAGSSYAASYAHVMDVNGDGFMDLVYPQDGGHWWIMFGSSSGFGTATDTGISSSGYQDALVLRYNGDNRADLILPNSSGNWRILKGTASGFSIEDTNTPATGDADGNYDMVDVNDDGLDDLIYEGSDNKIYQRLNTNGAFGSQTLRNSDTTYTLSTPSGLAGESAGFDTDFKHGQLRRRMLARMQLCSNLPVGTCHGYQKFYYNFLLGQGTLGNEANTAGQDGNIPVLLDFNGDGVTDAVWREPEPPDYSITTLYTIAGTAQQTPFNYYAETDTGLTYADTQDALIVDYDGDGKQDLLIPESNTSSQWHILRSNSETLQDIGTISLAAPGNADAVRVADINGDGLNDLVWASGGTWHYRLHSGVMPDLVTKITDGLGNYFALGYAPLTNSDVYTKGSSASYPDVDIQAPLYVVDQYTANDSSGDSYIISYQ